jgi:hypothetical protein
MVESSRSKGKRLSHVMMEDIIYCITPQPDGLAKVDQIEKALCAMDGHRRVPAGLKGRRMGSGQKAD